MSRRHVLLIDDDVWLGEQFARTLSRHDFEVTQARNGVSGMDAIDVQRPDVIVLDIFMPGPNGLVLLHELQSHGDLASIPVVLCSNSSADIALDILQPYGVQVVLDKTTMAPDDLVAAVRKVLL